MKVAVVHDWYLEQGGAEFVVDCILEIFPNSDFYCLFGDKSIFNNKHPETRFFEHPINRYLPVKRFYKSIPFLFPRLIEGFDLYNYDLVISSSHSFAKGVLISPNAVHVSYVHTPVRYVYDQMPVYKLKMGFLKRTALNILAHNLRNWDFISSQRIDYIIANSKFTRGRILKYWGKSSTVIYPPVRLDSKHNINYTRFTKPTFISYGRHVWYKRFDSIIDLAKNNPDCNFIIAGSGDETENLIKMSKNLDNLTIEGRLSDKALTELMFKSHGFLFCGEEDFGITIVEALNHKLPIFYLNKGGAREICAGLETSGCISFNDHNNDMNERFQIFKKVGCLEKACQMRLRERAHSFAKERFQSKLREACDVLTGEHL